MQSDPHSPSPEPPAPAEPGRDTPAGTSGAVAAPEVPAELTVPTELAASEVPAELSVPTVPAAPTSNGVPAHAATADHTPSPEAAGVGNGVPPAEVTAGTAEELGEQPAPPRARYNPFRYWLRPIVLAVLVVILLGLTYWDQQ